MISDGPEPVLGLDGAGIRVDWSDPVSRSRMSCALTGAVLQVSIDPGGSTRIWTTEAAIPTEYWRLDKARQLGH